MPLSSGQVLNNRYRIVKLLGQGGFGAVYRSWDTNLDEPVALKESFDTTPSAQRQFQLEAKLLFRLIHPNLPRVHDYFVLPGQGMYLVMDFIEGEDLGTLIQRSGGPLQEAQVLDWVGQVCEALTYLHEQNPPIIHRDIKPANIKITPAGRAILVDFGIAKLYNPDLSTTSGARAITPGYSPQEQYGMGTTDTRTDVYALGATIYHLLTGVQPPESIQRNLGAALLLVSQLNPAVSVNTAQAVEKAMQPLPDHRFQSISSFSTALKQQPGLVSPTVFAPVAQPVQSPSTTVSVAPMIQEMQAVTPAPKIPVPKIMGNIWKWIAALAAVAFLVLLGGYFMLNRGQGSPFEVAKRTETILAEQATPTATLRSRPTVISAPSASPTIVSVSIKLTPTVHLTLDTQPTITVTEPVITSITPANFAQLSMLTTLEGQSLVFAPGNELALLRKDYSDFDVLQVGKWTKLYELKKYSSFSYSPAGKFIYYVGGNYHSSILKISDGSLVLTIDGHLCFSKDDAWLAVWDTSLFEIRLYQTSDMSLRYTLSDPEQIRPFMDVAISPDGQFLVAGADDVYLRIFSLENGSLMNKLSLGYSAGYVELSPDGKLLAVNHCQQYQAYYCLSSTTSLLNTSDWQIVRDLDQTGEMYIHNFQFLVGGEVLFLGGSSKESGSFKSVAYYWRLSDGTALPNNLFPSPYGALAAEVDKQSISILSLPDGTIQSTLALPKAVDVSISFSPDNRILFVSAKQVGWLFDIQQGTLLQLPVGMPDPPSSLAFSLDMQYLSVSKDNSVQIWGISP